MGLCCPGDGRRHRLGNNVALKDLIVLTDQAEEASINHFSKVMQIYTSSKQRMVWPSGLSSVPAFHLLQFRMAC